MVSLGARANRRPPPLLRRCQDALTIRQQWNYFEGYSSNRPSLAFSTVIRGECGAPINSGFATRVKLASEFSGPRLYIASNGAGSFGSGKFLAVKGQRGNRDLDFMAGL